MLTNRGPSNRTASGRPYGAAKSIALLRLEAFSGGAIQHETAAGGYPELTIEPFGTGSRVVEVVHDAGYGQLTIEPFGGASQKLTEDLYFIDEPTVENQRLLANRIYVESPTHSVMVETPGVADENRIERKVPIEAGNEETCQVVGERLLEKWGRSQRSVSGDVDLVVTTKFREKMRVWVPAANIDEFMPLQKKEHDIAAQKTRLTLGDIIVGDNELIARIMSEL